MVLNRDITSIVNWCLDHLCPPILRDCRPLMGFIIRFAYGDKTKYVLDFKEKYPSMTDKDISTYYELIKDVPINGRATDLNKKSLEFVLNNLLGETFLDAACGRGFLAEQIFKMTNKPVVALDIVLPDKQISGVSFVAGDMKKLPFEDNSFDTVVCTHALEHIRDPKLALNELVRVAKKRLIIVVPHQREYKYTPDLHVNFFPYLYSFICFIGRPNTKYFKLGNDFGCIIEI